jgi:putative transposase
LLCYHKGMITLSQSNVPISFVRYHLVWCPSTVFCMDEVHMLETVYNLFCTISIQNKIILYPQSNITPTHVHLVVALPLSMSIATAIKLLKGISARQLRLTYPTLKTTLKRHPVWDNSYYATTYGDYSQDMCDAFVMIHGQSQSKISHK